MIVTNAIPTREEAENLLAWGYDLNPGVWTEHCRNTAKVASRIARECGLDAEVAYVLGLMHDIGYYDFRNGKGKTCHIFTGYELMMKKKHAFAARICLSHSFPIPDVRAYGGADFNCSDEQQQLLSRFLSETEYNEYDKLIQVSDTIGSASGMVIMEKRMLDVIIRSGFNEFSREKCSAYLALKDHFDAMCGMNIYNLFYDEIVTDIMKKPAIVS